MTENPTGSRSLVLLSLDWLRSKDPRTSLGHASLLARLDVVETVKTRPVSRAVNAEDFDQHEVLTTLLGALGHSDAHLAIGVYVWNEAIVRWLLRALRAHGFQGPIILGGPQISYAPAGVHELYPEADVIIRGYGEDALVQVLTSPPGTAIQGVVWRGLPDAATHAAVDLPSLPSPILSGTLPVQPFMRWETQRGCIYACSFCQHREPGARIKKRMLAPGRVRNEIDAMVAGGANDIAVLDPIFNHNPDATAILERFVESGYTGRLSLQARFEMLTEPFLDACERLNVRLEFGLQTVIPSEMRAAARMNQLAKVEQAIATLHERGIRFEVSLIYGLPTQTLASFEESVRWCQERGVEVILAFPLMLLRGTQLDRQRDRWGLQESDDQIPVVVQSDSFSRAEWEQMRTLADSLSGGPAKRSAA